MFKITFSLSPIDAVLSEFELGNMEVQIEDKIITSNGRTPSQSMMMVIAVADLLDGIRTLIEQDKKEYLFVGAASSFTILFRKNKARVSLTNNGVEYSLSMPEFTRELQRESNAFFNQLSLQLDTTKSAMQDLSDSLKAFNKLP